MNDSVVKSVGRVFEVLELFEAERIALSATAVARTLKYPASSTVALLKSMVQLGYLTYDHIERSYFPTVRVPLLSAWIEQGFFTDGHLFQLIDEIHTTTDESTYLSWQSDLEMQYVRLRAGSQESAPSSKAGTHVPLFGSVSGLLALSLKRDVEIVKLVERLNQVRRKTDPQVDLAAAMEQIRRFRQQGYGVGSEGGIGTLAWVLRQKGSTRSVIVSVMGPADRIKAKEKTVVPAVRTAIQRAGAA
jgi:IclR family KDG regulon transcriptional repressor